MADGSQAKLGEEPTAPRPRPTIDEVEKAIKGLGLVENGVKDLGIRLGKIEGDAREGIEFLERIRDLMKEKEAPRGKKRP